MVSLSKKKTVKPEKILEEIEKHLKNITERKKEIEKNFTSKFKELENQAKENEKWFIDRTKAIGRFKSPFCQQ